MRDGISQFFRRREPIARTRYWQLANHGKVPWSCGGTGVKSMDWHRHCKNNSPRAVHFLD
jgi:hypothetical protein